MGEPIMPQHMTELWMAITSQRLASAQLEVASSKDVIQQLIIEAIQDGASREALRRLFIFSGLSKDTWNELAPMEAQFS